MLVRRAGVCIRAITRLGTRRLGGAVAVPETLGGDGQRHASSQAGHALGDAFFHGGTAVPAAPAAAAPVTPLPGRTGAGTDNMCRSSQSKPGTDSGRQQRARGEGSQSSDQETAVARDSTFDWIRGHMERAVADGRQSEKSAAYFSSILYDFPEFAQCSNEARRIIGDQDPQSFTKYQQGQFADRISKYMSGIASDRLMRAHNEENQAKKYTQDGTPTGENYWFEAGNTLASPSVPGFLKDEILVEMQRDRKKNSPAYDEPREGEFNPSDVEYAEAYRTKRMRLLRPDDNGVVPGG